MALRFRKSIKIAPGVRMNVGKRGFTSIGVGKMNFGKRGVHQNFNIPGTGISYQAQIVGRSSNSNQHSSKIPSKTSKSTMSVMLSLTDDGSLLFLNNKGQPLPENIVQLAKKQQKDVIVEWLDEQATEFNKEIDDIIGIHLTTPAPEGEVIINPLPQEPKLVESGVASKFIGRLRDKNEEKNRLAMEAYEESIRQWRIADHSLKTDPNVMSEVLANTLSTLEWPRETIISFEIRDNGTSAILDIDLPEIEDMPNQEANVNRSQLRLNVKTRTDKSIRLSYLSHIHAVGFRIVGDVFAYLPSIMTVVVSGYSQRVNKNTGHIENEYLYSARIQRDQWKRLNFNNLEAIDIVDCFNLFDLRRKVTSTGLISPIEPFEA